MAFITLLAVNGNAMANYANLKREKPAWGRRIAVFFIKNGLGGDFRPSSSPFFISVVPYRH